MALMDKLTSMAQSLTDLRDDCNDALREKGADTIIILDSLPNAIRSIEQGGGETFDPDLITVRSGSDPMFDYSTDKKGAMYDYCFRNNAKLRTFNASNVTMTGTYSFYGCTGLTNVTMDKCQSIGNYAFQGCTNLVNVYAPECLEVGSYAFAKSSSTAASALNKITLGACTSIGTNAFRYQKNLREIEFLDYDEDFGLPQMSGDPFNGITDAQIANITIKFPAAAQEWFDDSDWSEYDFNYQWV